MGAIRGAVSGGIGLSALYLVVTSKQEGLATAAGLPGKVLHWLIDPTVPLIPDRRATNSSVVPGDAGIGPGFKPTPGSTSSTPTTGTKTA